MNCPRAVLFDLDDTLAESFKPPKPETLDKLKRLLDHVPCAIITAAGFARINEQILPELSTSKNVWRFYVFPNSAADCYSWDGESWQKSYTFALTPEERTHITEAIQRDAKSIVGDDPVYKWRIIDREAQVAFAAIGLDAPLEEKKAWDPDQKKRKKLQKTLEKQLPEFEVLIGGMTTIDITRKGINKSYGVEWMAKKLDCKASEMLYVGDALFPGGNDYVVIPTGIQTRMVSGPADTSVVLDELLSICGS
ncbi:MAG: HAD-IIB family hydrolase [bacterium]|nr:HAD-IIB family hydrolase [bacterium]